jgi:hypothetical protein
MNINLKKVKIRITISTKMREDFKCKNRREKTNHSVILL